MFIRRCNILIWCVFNDRVILFYVHRLASVLTAHKIHLLILIYLAIFNFTKQLLNHFMSRIGTLHYLACFKHEVSLNFICLVRTACFFCNVICLWLYIYAQMHCIYMHPCTVFISTYLLSCTSLVANVICFIPHDVK